jgi:Recombinase zinc beta ribbon domain
MAMTLRTGKSGRYRYYTCSTKSRQGETGCKGRTVPMDKLDTLIADHIERRLLRPARLEEILSSAPDRREETAERRATHIAESRNRAAAADAKLKRLYNAIENGVANLADPMLKGRVAELKAIRDQAHADAERAEGAMERRGPTITPPVTENVCQAGPQAHADRGRRLPPRLLASWGRKANCFARSSPLQAQKRRVLACPVLYRSGAPDRIRTYDLCLRTARRGECLVVAKKPLVR